MTEDLVSVVIPCFNAERWVGRAISSALEQTHAGVEVLVVDDGSNDSSLDVIRSFDAAVRWWSGPNRGGCAARNTGLRHARGRWVQFLDADDTLLPTCVESKLGAAGSNPGIVCCDVLVQRFGSVAADGGFWNRSRYRLEDMLRTGSPQTSAPLHRRELLSTIGGFREGLPCAQEYDLHLRLAATFDLEFWSTGEVGVMITAHPESLSRAAGLEKMDGTIRQVLAHCTRLLADHGRLSEERRAAIAQHYTEIAKRMWRAGNRRGARDLAVTARQLSLNWPVGCYRNSYATCLARVVGLCGYERLSLLWRSASARLGQAR